MSKPNKANKNNYVQAGRMTSDEMARELKKMGQGSSAKVRGSAGSKERVTGRAAREPNRPRSAPEE